MTKNPFIDFREDWYGGEKALRTKTQLASCDTLRTVIHDTNETGNGPHLRPSGYSSVTFQVSGGFRGLIYPRGKVSSDQPFNRLPCYDWEGNLVKDIVEDGIYYIDVSGFNEVAIRLDKVDSGNVLVVASYNVLPVSLIRSMESKDCDSDKGKSAKRNVLIGHVVGLEVPASSAREIVGSDIIFEDELYNNGGNRRPISSADFLYCYAVMRTDESHEYTISKTYTYPSGTFGHQTGPTTIFDIKESDDKRCVTEWTELNGSNFGLRVNNKDDKDHIYDVVIYGVR